MDSFKNYRFKTNPKEKEFFDKFLKHHNRDGYTDMDNIVFGTDERGIRPAQYLTDREKKVVLSTIQWLGSPVGQSFLNDCGFELKENENKPIKDKPIKAYTHTYKTINGTTLKCNITMKRPKRYVIIENENGVSVYLKKKDLKKIIDKL